MCHSGYVKNVSLRVRLLYLKYPWFRPAERAKRVAQDEIEKQMKHVKTNLDKLEKNIQQVRKLAKKDPDDQESISLIIWNV